MALKGNQKKLDKNNNNRIDAQDFKILKAEKAKGRGMGLQDEKVKPGKVIKAKRGTGILSEKGTSKNFAGYSKAGPTKISLSDPSKPYKKISTDRFKYPDRHKLSGKEVKSTYHEDVSNKEVSGYTFIEPSNPALYFDAFAIKVNPLMRGTQKTYKKLGGLVVDMFKPIRYN